MAHYERFAFEKLAAGGLPAKLLREGCRVAYHTPTPAELLHELPRKLSEELTELQEALVMRNPQNLCAELADVVEVLLAMGALPVVLQRACLQDILAMVVLIGLRFGIGPAEIEAARQAKRNLKGGLETAIYLEYADVPLNDAVNAPCLAQFRADPIKYRSLGLVE